MDDNTANMMIKRWQTTTNTPRVCVHKTLADTANKSSPTPKLASLTATRVEGNREYCMRWRRPVLSSGSRHQTSAVTLLGHWHRIGLVVARMRCAQSSKSNAARDVTGRTWQTNGHAPVGMPNQVHKLNVHQANCKSPPPLPTHPQTRAHTLVVNTQQQLHSPPLRPQAERAPRTRKPVTTSSLPLHLNLARARRRPSSHSWQSQALVPSTACHELASPSAPLY